ncbi:hypothetical protein GTO89_01215 [Heliobacterium gestii]|uniref:Aminoacyl-transfer RNA synthetases class-II family profile domain-containing protein n=1 Tax=Heliomicrobium gestii TaxID=2699 RepID=A0A845LAF4_HELGE|nr:amino acid--tRNA ligase-related protein [Heliomicrobium gestii]MBM7865389.1 asparaginyl-tRNA synthetase [Heliomicrobium gestii]MZP41649.1 hypothetical protein [Heliomicrobium gestii]
MTPDDTKVNAAETITGLEGRVLAARDIGGILFFDVLAQNRRVKLLCRRDETAAEAFARIRATKRNDYCRFAVRECAGELHIVDQSETLERTEGGTWPEERLQALRAYSLLLDRLRLRLGEHGFAEVRLPAIHPGAHKKEAFLTNFFGKSARLTTSNALYLNVYTAQLGRAYSLQRCFRAEPSKTNRHLAEFDMLEVAAVNETITSVMAALEGLIKDVVGDFARSEFASAMAIDAKAVTAAPFPVIDYRELAARYCFGGKGLGQREREIAERGPLFVVHFPRSLGSWMAKPVDGEHTLSFNLLLPGVGEAAEGNEKQTDMALLRQKLKRANIESQLGWYLRMMPYTNFSLSGFGLGVERLFMWLFGCTNIRQIHLFYRDMTFSETHPHDDGAVTTDITGITSINGITTCMEMNDDISEKHYSGNRLAQKHGCRDERKKD